MVNASDPQAASARPRPLLAIAKAAFLFLSSVVAGLLWSALALVCVSFVNQWDDALGTGFVVIGVVLLGALSGSIGGAISAAAVWNSRLGSVQGLAARVIMRAVQLAILSEALLVGSLLSMMTTRTSRAGWGLAPVLFVAGVLLLWKAGRMIVRRPTVNYYSDASMPPESHT